MERLEEARNIACEFLKRALDAKEVRVIGVVKSGDNWDAEVEVYEESSFIKSLGLPTKTQDRNFYSVKLDAGLEVESYGRIKEGSE